VTLKRKLTIRKVEWNTVFSSADGFSHFLQVLSIKRQASRGQNVQNDTQTPNVDFRSSVSAALEKFWGSVSEKERKNI
jgi:hypothetical protein